MLDLWLAFRFGENTVPARNRKAATCFATSLSGQVASEARRQVQHPVALLWVGALAWPRLCAVLCRMAECHRHASLELQVTSSRRYKTVCDVSVRLSRHEDCCDNTAYIALARMLNPMAAANDGGFQGFKRLEPFTLDVVALANNNYRTG